MGYGCKISDSKFCYYVSPASRFLIASRRFVWLLVVPYLSAFYNLCLSSFYLLRVPVRHSREYCPATEIVKSVVTGNN